MVLDATRNKLHEGRDVVLFSTVSTIPRKRVGAWQNISKYLLDELDK